MAYGLGIRVLLTFREGVNQVLRDFKKEDTERLIELINNVDTGYEIDDLDDIQRNAMKFIVFEEVEVKGFAYASEIGRAHV